MKISQNCDDHPPTTPYYRSEYEASYMKYSLQSSPSPPHSPTPSPTTSSWSGTFAQSHHDDTLRSVLRGPRVTKTASSSSMAHHRNHQHLNGSDGLSYGIINHVHSHRGSATRSPSSIYRSSPYGAPRRSNNRLPSVIDRIKTDLKNPNRSSASFSPQQQQHSVNHRSPSPQPMYPEMMGYEDGPLPQPLPAPTLFGVRCTEVSQRAYSGQSSQMKRSFDRLQRMDSGKVEYRTIAFCTHLTVSRWEPVSPYQPQSPTSTAAVAIAAAATPSSPSEESCPPTSTTPSSAKNDPAHAARLMSLANYIRHILSLTAGIASGQTQAALKQQQHKQEQTCAPDALSPPSSGHSSSHKTSGPGPIKSESSRRHRYSPDYHHHQGRRNMQHQQQLDTRSSSTTSPYDHGYREGDQYSDQQQSRSQQEYHEQNRTQPQFHPHQHRHHSQHPSPTSPWINHARSTTRNLPPLLKIPHPNLTLTLALMYIDRLKAKYPEARGEPGCSHRLFLVAFIIAAKYRCSVELSPSLPEDMDAQGEDHGDPERWHMHDEFSRSRRTREQVERSPNSLEQTLEARLNAELIFSNHAWVRLLNLGSFYRQPPTKTANTAAAASSSSSSSSSTLSQSSSHDQLAGASAAASGQAPPSSATSPTQPQCPSLMSIIHSASGSSPAVPMTMLQVEDLDRMEAEFLTFLNFDLATMSHDLQTCWNLLVGKNEIS